MKEKQRAKRSYIKDLIGQSGSEVEVFGWINTRRDHGKIIFLDLRDSTGLLQIVATPKSEDSYKIASNVTSEDVVRVKGELKDRPDANVNKDLPTGKLELTIKELEILGKDRKSV